MPEEDIDDFEPATALAPPRRLVALGHPGLAAAASHPTNPILLLSILGVAALVVSARRPEAPWARSFVVFLQLGLFVVGFRLLFQVLFGAPRATTC